MIDWLIDYKHTTSRCCNAGRRSRWAEHWAEHWAESWRAQSASLGWSGPLVLFLLLLPYFLPISVQWTALFPSFHNCFMLQRSATLRRQNFTCLKTSSPQRQLLGLVTVFGRANHLGISSSHSVELSLLPSVGREMSTGKVRWRSAAESKGSYGSFHLWINVWAAGKTVSSLINTCHTWAL